jgi:beta-glucosidase
VLLKNKEQVLPLKEKTKVYLPKKFIPSTTNWWGVKSEEKWVDPVNLNIASKYFEVVDSPEAAEVGIVFVSAPMPGTGYEPSDRESGGSGYVPISLQYGPYLAKDAREQSIAAGDPVIAPTVTNRSYKGKTAITANQKELEIILETRKAMAGKPVIVVVTAGNSMVFNEFEKSVDGILLHFGVQDQAVMDILTGKAEPSALLPVQMPADMFTVEVQMEDVPHDMVCYVDEAGNEYDFGFGLNWKGVIDDARTQKFKRPDLTK